MATMTEPSQETAADEPQPVPVPVPPPHVRTEGEMSVDDALGAADDPDD
jgi:hypothetical protein